MTERRADVAAWQNKLEQGYKPGDPEPTPNRPLVSSRPCSRFSNSTNSKHRFKLKFNRPISKLISNSRGRYQAAHKWAAAENRPNEAP